jgi:hypothetical protein
VGLSGGGRDGLGVLLGKALVVVVLVADALGRAVAGGPTERLGVAGGDWLVPAGVELVAVELPESARLAGWPQPEPKSAARLTAAISALLLPVFLLANGFPLLAETVDVRP